MNAEDWTERRLRHEVALEAELRYPDGRSEAVRIDNLSLDGCCVVGSLRIGDRVQIELPKVGRVNGQVRWALGGRAGLRFLRDTDAASAEGEH